MGLRQVCPNPAKYLLQLYHHNIISEMEVISKGSLMWFCEDCWAAAKIHYAKVGITWEH
jgi:hypothetical protein